MVTVHFIYPHGPSISCPDAIGRNVERRLAERYRVIHYDWDDFRAIKPGPHDVLLGHPHPAPWTIFRRSLKQRGWRRVVVLSPYHHGDTFQVAFLDSLLSDCHLYLAITGNYWSQSVTGSLFSHWLPKMVFLDLAVDPQDFPVLKKAFNPPGKRRFVYVGHSGWPKNTDYLTQIARAMPNVEFSWIGGGNSRIAGLTSHGFQDFSREGGRKIIAGHDFLITVGNADANPATILEAMAWGLIPVCTPQSGYVGYPGIVNVPLNDVRGVVEILRKLLEMPNEGLREIQTSNWEALNEHFNWDRFAAQIVHAIESNECPDLGVESLSTRFKILYAKLLSPYSLIHPYRFIRYLIDFVRNQTKVKNLN
jgi:glycosyltransferase involved in cell wall biosynthesis